MKIVRPVAINDAQLVSSNIAENDYAAWNSGTTYALGDRRIYVAADTHWIVESLQNSNTNHVPTGLASDAWWLKVSDTNRWKMFDEFVTSQSSNADSIQVSLTTANRADSVALMNISAATAQVTMTDAVDGLVYDQTVTLTSNSGIHDWYAYFFEPIVRLSDYVFTEMPPYVNATIAITLSDSGATVLLGECVLGMSKEFGGTQHGASVGITDYSVKSQDAFGNYTITERAFSKRGEFQVYVENTLIDEVQKILAQYRATPVVYVGADDYTSTFIYGFYKDFSIVIAYPEVSICNIQIEGLT